MKPKRTILCVDGNEQSLSIRKVLLETRGYRVAAHSTGEEAFERFKRGGIDLVLADLGTAAVEASRLVERVKDLSPQTPVILLSAKMRGLDQEMRADVFLSRNMCAPADLLERVRVLLVRKRGPKRAPPRPPAGQAGAA